MKKHFKRLMGLALVVAMTLSVFAACGGLEKKYKLSFDANGGANAPETILSIRSGSTVNEPAKKPTREDFTFTNWYKESECTTVWDFSVDTVTADTTVYAGWTVTRMTVTFDANGGKNAPKILTGVKAGTKVLEPEINRNPSRGGYIFSGWYTASTAKSSEGFDFTKNTITSETILYAGWTFSLDDYRNLAARQIYYYYQGLSDDEREDAEEGVILGSLIVDYNDIRGYFAGNASDMNDIDELLESIKAEVAGLCGVTYLDVMKAFAKENIASFADDFKYDFEMEVDDPVAVLLDTIVQNAFTAIDAAATIDAVDTLGISANAEIENAVLDTYKAYYTEKTESVFDEILAGDLSDSEKALFNARKAEIFGLLDAAQSMDAAYFIEDVYYNIGYIYVEDFLYHSEKVTELREWVDALKAANDFNPDALERINNLYIDFLTNISYFASMTDYTYEAAIKNIYETVTAVDGVMADNLFIEILQARKAAIEKIEEYIDYLDGKPEHYSASYAADDYIYNMNSLSNLDEIQQELNEAMTVIEGIAGVSFEVAREEYYIGSLNSAYQIIRDSAGEGSAEETQIDAIYAQAVLDVEAATDGKQMKEIVDTAVNEMGDLALDGVKAYMKDDFDSTVSLMLQLLPITPDDQLSEFIDGVKSDYCAQIDAAGSMAEILSIMSIVYNDLFSALYSW